MTEKTPTETTETSELATQDVSQQNSVFSPTNFDHSYRVAKVLCSSSMVPEIFKGEANIGNCMIALNLSGRLGADPMLVMQKMYIIKGKPAIEAQLQIALFQRSERFGDLQYVFNSEKTECYCTAKNSITGEEARGTTVSIAMAKAEGWQGKWKNIPELMLRYRAASFFISQHDPASRMGMMEKGEAEDATQVKQADYTQVPDVNHAKEASEKFVSIFSGSKTEKDLRDALNDSKKEEFGVYRDDVKQSYLMAVERIMGAEKAEAPAPSPAPATAPAEPNFSEEISDDEII